MSAQNQNGYLLLFRGNEWYHELSVEEVQKVNNQCKAWFERLAAGGKVKGGHLVRKGAIISEKSGRVVSDGPFTAIAIARTRTSPSPSLAYGTSIEVRPVTDECPLETCARQIPREEQFASASA